MGDFEAGRHIISILRQVATLTVLVSVLGFLLESRAPPYTAADTLSQLSAHRLDPVNS